MATEELKKLEQLEKDIECSICRDYIKTPTVAVACGHEFCRTCIEQWNRTRGQCPICREDIQRLMYLQNHDVIIKNYLLLIKREKQLIYLKKDYMELKEKLSNIVSFAGIIEKEASFVCESFDLLRTCDDVKPFEEVKTAGKTRPIEEEK